MSMNSSTHRNGFDTHVAETAQLTSAPRGGEGGGRRSPSRLLTAEESMVVSGVGGAGVHGRGVLLGWLYVREQRVILVTGNPGTRHEVCFSTDVSEREALAHDGERVALAGVIRKLSPWIGTVTRARLVAWPERHYMPGQYVVLQGQVVLRHPVGRDRAALPAGAWLILPECIHLRRLRTREVFLPTRKRLPQGYGSQFHGRIAVRHDGGGEASPHAHAILTGVADLRSGEPFYDGLQFRSAGDQGLLHTLVLAGGERVHHAPSEVLVLEPARKMAYAGTRGGLHRPLESPFHGFYGQAPMAAPTDADRAAIRFDEQGNGFSAVTGAQLRVLDREGPTHPHPDAMYAAYLFDAHRYTVYKVLSGGFAGFLHHLEWVIHVPRAQD